MKTMQSNKNCSLNMGVQLRKFPYPYCAMLAICSDLDGTPDSATYLEIMRFLNTTEETSMGTGVGLEVGNSIHFRAIPPQFSYWDTDDTGREMVRTLIHSGHIDCLHSFGERIYSRDEVKAALDELVKHDCRLEVWVDHGSAITNFGADIMDGHGDQVGHPAYHADLTIPYGIKYVWRGQTTSIIGQDTLPKLAGIFSWHHPFLSSKTMFKEAVKQKLARIGNIKYSMHGLNKLLRKSVLRDGANIYEFLRCNPHWHGVSFGDRGRYIGEVLTNKMLKHLIEREGTCILYTHLGRIDNTKIPFPQKAINGLKKLQEELQSGNILVTTTRRLLGYRRATCDLKYNIRTNGKIVTIDVDILHSGGSVGELNIRDLSGLTFYVPEPQKIRLTVNGQKAVALKINSLDHTGRSSVSIPWLPLEFPSI